MKNDIHLLFQNLVANLVYSIVNVFLSFIQVVLLVPNMRISEMCDPNHATSETPLLPGTLPARF